MNKTGAMAAMASAAAASLLSLHAGTIGVPGDFETVAEALASATAGDEVVLARGTYAITERLDVPEGVTMRGATGHFADVVISGGGKTAVAVRMLEDTTVRDLTISGFTETGISSDGSVQRPKKVIGCRITGIIGGSAWKGTAISMNSAGIVTNCVIDSCVGGSQRLGNALVLGFGALVTGCVITNNSVVMAVGAGTMPNLITVDSGRIENTFIGHNDYGVLRPNKSAVADKAGWGLVRVKKGVIDNCVVACNRFRGKIPFGCGAVRNDGGTVRNTIVVGNGTGSDDCACAAGLEAGFVSCLTSDTAGMTGSFVATAGDVFVKEGALPWLPHGSAAVGAGTDGADIGRVWRPDGPTAGIVSDRRTCLVGKAAHLTAVSDRPATFGWQLLSGPATLTADGATATLTFAAPGSATVRVVTDAAAEETLTLSASAATFGVTTAEELVSAVGQAHDGAEIVLAKGTYAPSAELVLANAVTVRGATGDRSDVIVDGSGRQRVFTIDHPGAVISSLTVANGMSSSFAAGVFMETGGTLTNVAVAGCRSTGWSGCHKNGRDFTWHSACGGSVCNYGGTVLDCDFSGNRRTVPYNAPSVYAHLGPHAFADRLTVTNNLSSRLEGNGDYRATPVAVVVGGTIRNAFVAYNDSDHSAVTAQDADASGVFVDGGRLENATVFRNKMAAVDKDRMPGVYLKSGEAVNCLVAETADQDGAAAPNWGAADASGFSFCATTPVAGLSGTCVEFAGSPYALGGGYPMPKANSPTIDAGDDTQSWVGAATDLFGNARRMGAGVDIGAAEYAPPDVPLACEIHVADASGAAPFTTTLTCTTQGACQTGLTYAWVAVGVWQGRTNRIERVTAEPSCTFAGLPVGSYSFELTVTNDRQPPDVARDESEEGSLTVLPGVCYVSPTGSHAPPFDSPETAATNFTDAIRTAHGKVVALPGAYCGLTHVLDDDGVDFAAIVTKAIRVEGPADASEAVVDCAGGGGFKLANAGAVLSGLTFTNFSTKVKSAVLHVVSGVASNVVVNGRGIAFKPAVSPVFVTGLLTDSTIKNVRDTGWSGCHVVRVEKSGILRRVSVVDNRAETMRLVGLVGSAERRPLAEGCVLLRNSSAYEILTLDYADAAGCDVSHNSVRHAFVVPMAHGSTLRRCRIVGNSISESSSFAQGIVWQAPWTKNLPGLMENCLIACNTSSVQKAANVLVDPSDGRLLIRNTTVADNVTESYAGVHAGQTDTYHAYLEMSNSIVWGNTANGMPHDVANSSPKNAISASCFREAEAGDGNGNVADDPKFLRAREEKAYWLSESSPCVDAGETGSWTEKDVDLAGERRVVGRSVDMGAYEHQRRGLALVVR